MIRRVCFAHHSIFILITVIVICDISLLCPYTGAGYPPLPPSRPKSLSVPPGSTPSNATNGTPDIFDTQTAAAGTAVALPTAPKTGAKAAAAADIGSSHSATHAKSAAAAAVIDYSSRRNSSDGAKLNLDQLTLNDPENPWSRVQLQALIEGVELYGFYAWDVVALVRGVGAGVKAGGGGGGN